MKITRNKKDGTMHLSIAGRLDAVTAVEADNDFNKIIAEGHNNLLIDLNELDYISSAGLRVLLVVAKRIQQNNGKVVLCSLTTNVKEVFEISGFSSIFNIFPTSDEAIQFMQD